MQLQIDNSETLWTLGTQEMCSRHSPSCLCIAVKSDSSLVGDRGNIRHTRHMTTTKKMMSNKDLTKRKKKNGGESRRSRRVSNTFFFQQYFSYFMATSVSGGRSRSTRREPPTMGKQLVNFITCGCESSAPFIVIQKAGREPTPYWW